MLVLGNVAQQEIVARIMGGPLFVKRLADEMGYVYKGPVRLN